MEPASQQAASRRDPLADTARVRQPIYGFMSSRATSATRLTSDPAIDWLAATHGRRTEAASSFRPNAMVVSTTCIRSLASGAGNEELLVKSSEDKSVQDWSRDGRFLLYSVAVGGRTGRFTTSHDLWFLPLTPAAQPARDRRKPEVYLKTEFNENQGQFSPDGRFIAYCPTHPAEMRSMCGRSRKPPMASGRFPKAAASRPDGAATARSCSIFPPIQK